MQLIPVIENTLQNPPIPFEPNKQTLKAWATFCLRNRGFKIVFAQNADFAIETRTGEKVYFNTATDDQELAPPTGWIVWNSDTQTIRVIAPQP